ncbi:unnamed protein product [Caenorhabditis nigoni]
MRTSSVHLIMSAVAVSDISFMIEHFYHLFIQVAIAYSGCIDERTYGMLLAELVFMNLSDFAKRCSIWFCVSIALIRTLVIRNPLSLFYEKLSNPFASYVAIPIITLVSLSLSVFKATFYEIVIRGTMYPCSSNITVDAFSYIIADSYDSENADVLKYFNVVDSMISSIIPCIFLPFITVLLILELKKASENRSKLFSSAKDKESEKTTQLVFYFTLAFFVAAFPLGVASTMMYFFLGKPGFL